MFYIFHEEETKEKNQRVGERDIFCSLIIREIACNEFKLPFKSKYSELEG